MPFRETDSEFTILKAIVEDHFPSPTKINPSIPKSLSQIVMKTIENEPKNRYQSADEILEAINKFENETEPEPVLKTPSRKKRNAVVSVVVFAILMSLSIVYFNFTDKITINMISHSGYWNLGPRSPRRSGSGKSVSSKNSRNKSRFCSIHFLEILRKKTSKFF